MDYVEQQKRQQRNKKLVKEYQEGVLSLNALARKYGISQQRAWQIVKKSSKNENRL